jgi:hypothetical protein
MSLSHHRGVVAPAAKGDPQELLYHGEKERLTSVRPWRGSCRRPPASYTPRNGECRQRSI